MENTNDKIIPSFQYFFRQDVLILQWMGLPSFNTVFSSDKFESSWQDDCYFVISIWMIFSVAFTQLYTILYVGVDLNSGIDIFSGMSTILLSGIKRIRWWSHRHQLYNIVRQLSTRWDTIRRQNSFTVKDLKAARNAKLMRRVYMISVSIVLVSYALRPYMMYLAYLLKQETDDLFDYYNSTVNPAKYPFAIDSLQKFCIVVTYQQIVACIVCICWASSDTLFAQIVTHISIQFHVLAKQLETIDEKNSKFKHNDHIRRQLRTIVKQHQELFLHCGLIEILYNPVIFLTVISNGISLCSCLYLIEDQLSTSDWSGASKSVSHLITLSIQTVIYCGYADRLTRSSAQVCNAAYRSQWTGWSIKNKKLLIIIMMRATNEYQCTAYGMISLNLKQLTTIVNGAVSYFMLLRRFG